ncbi:acyl-CoA thioesterase [Flavobacterium sp. JP2137]|uniref:acyl-CoA thioesterase n=1 Tax=Flavobacterium sp. JP2137 TaxID=3414510 RepID=UPI003D2FABAA
MIKGKELYREIPELTVTSEIRVRFNETDALGIVWHGNYISYFEDGREAFGRAHQIAYLDVMRNGYSTPIVKSVCEHKLPLKYGDTVRVETRFVDTPAAKMIFRYRLFNADDKVVCTGETTQVFLDQEGNLSLNIPAFFEAWKKEIGLL